MSLFLASVYFVSQGIQQDTLFKHRELRQKIRQSVQEKYNISPLNHWNRADQEEPKVFQPGFLEQHMGIKAFVQLLEPATQAVETEAKIKPIVAKIQRLPNEDNKTHMSGRVRASFNKLRENIERHKDARDCGTFESSDIIIDSKTNKEEFLWPLPKDDQEKLQNDVWIIEYTDDVMMQMSFSKKGQYWKFEVI